MADLKEDRIDFNKLEKELNAAVEADASYWRENDAKLRAMEQRVETYDQFRDMVAAAHIKPLDKKDKIGQSKRQQPWNPFSSSSTAPTAAQDTGSQVQSIITKVKIPKNGHEFTKEWRNRKKSPGSCYSYLLDLGGETLSRIFRSEISFGLLGEIITALDNDAEEGHCGKVANILMCLTRAGRFSLSLDFLNKSEKEALSKLINKLEQWGQAGGKTRKNSDRTPQNCDIGETPEVHDGGSKTEDLEKESLTDDGKEETEEGSFQENCEQIMISAEDVEKLKHLYNLLQTL
ncbi:coiled-coil domain-containing protein 103-like isoform X2 [Lytechinus pictus]